MENNIKTVVKKDVDEANKFRKANTELVQEELKQQYYKKDSKLLSYKVEDKSVNKKNIAYCSAKKVFGDCNNDNYMKHSHTLSRGNILRNLSCGDKLIRFNDHKMPDENTILKHILDYYSEVSIDDASVTVSFCKTHDEELFAAIEKDGNTDYLGTTIQNVEYSLKAITFDIYYKIMNIRYFAQLIEINKSIVYNPDGSQSKYFMDYHNAVETLFKLYPLMLKMLKELKQLIEQGIESELKTVYFELPVSMVNFALSEVIYLEDSICYVNVINSKKPYVIVSYYKDSGRIVQIDKLKKQYDLCNNLNINEQLKCLWSFTKELLINAQNIYFNKTAFHKLTSMAKVYLYCVHREGVSNIPSNEQKIYDNELINILYTR